MSNQSVAAVASAPGPIEGNDHNSSPNFQFVELPASGELTIGVSDNPSTSSITFNLWHEKGGLPDDKIASGLGDGSTINVSDVEMDANYYVGDPSNADNQTFVVTLSADFG